MAADRVLPVYWIIHRSSMTMRKRWETPKMNRMRESARQNHYGRSCASHTHARGTYTSFTTSEKPSPESYMTGYWRRVMQTPSELDKEEPMSEKYADVCMPQAWSQNGRKQDMKSCAVSGVYRREYVTLANVPRNATDLLQQDMNYQGSTCVCRVPKAQVRAGTIVECVHCGLSSLLHILSTYSSAMISGCRGCSSDSWYSAPLMLTLEAFLPMLSVFNIAILSILSCILDSKLSILNSSALHTM